MSRIDLPDELKSRLLRAARRRGFAIEHGREFELAKYIAYLLQLDELNEAARRQRHTLPQALGLLSDSRLPAPTDADIDQLLADRRLRH